MQRSFYVKAHFAVTAFDLETFLQSVINIVGGYHNVIVVIIIEKN